jgi:shikimate dehydrogenase
MSNRSISRDTQPCISLAGRPRDFGTRIQYFLYEEMGLDYVYKAFTTNDLAAAIAGVRAIGIRGCGLSMVLSGLAPPSASLVYGPAWPGRHRR